MELGLSVGGDSSKEQGCAGKAAQSSSTPSRSMVSEQKSKLLHVALDRDPHEGVARVRQEADEPVRDVAAVEDLEDEAAPPHAELESRHRVLLPFRETGPPLYVEAHDQVVQTAAMDGLHLGDPVNDLSGLVGDQGSDNVSLELNVEQIGGSVHVVNNANFHSYGGFKDFRGRERERRSEEEGVVTKYRVPNS
nr:hypothetical protein CISIN_1g027598mg [Ipomoea trifida]